MQNSELTRETVSAVEWRFVTVAVLTIRPLGATLQTAAIIAGQLTMAAVVDHYGLLGVQVRPLTAAHAGGLGLLAAGVAILAKT